MGKLIDLLADYIYEIGVVVIFSILMAQLLPE
jgi:hypothetical protein